MQLKPQHFPLPVTLPFRLAMLGSSRALMLSHARGLQGLCDIDRRRQRANARGRVLYRFFREGANIESALTREVETPAYRSCTKQYA